MFSCGKWIGCRQCLRTDSGQLEWQSGNRLQGQGRIQRSLSCWRRCASPCLPCFDCSSAPCPCIRSFDSLLKLSQIARKTERISLSNKLFFVFGSPFDTGQLRIEFSVSCRPCWSLCGILAVCQTWRSGCIAGIRQRVPGGSAAAPDLSLLKAVHCPDTECTCLEFAPKVESFLISSGSGGSASEVFASADRTAWPVFLISFQKLASSSTPWSRTGTVLSCSFFASLATGFSDPDSTISTNGSLV